MSAAEPSEIDSLIPHSGQSVLLDRVVSHDGDSTTTGVVVGSQPWLVRADGSVPPWLALEYMAQSIAAHESLLARACGEKLPSGFLASVTGLELSDVALRSGDRLEVRTTRLRGRPGLGAISHRCTVVRIGAGGEREEIGRARLSVSTRQRGG